VRQLPPSERRPYAFTSRFGELDAPASVYRGAYVDIAPRSLQLDAPPAGVVVEPLRVTTPTTESPAWAARLAARHSVVYVTLGTQFNDAGRFTLLLEALADVECTALLTIGADLDPGALGAVPANAVVERFVPQPDLLPLLDAVPATPVPVRRSPRSLTDCPLCSFPPVQTSSTTRPQSPPAAPGSSSRPAR
jgi:hypothetical protein